MKAYMYRSHVDFKIKIVKCIHFTISMLIIATLLFTLSACTFECTGLKAANRYIDGLDSSLKTREFRDNYWHGFWSIHADCAICVLNDDVPSKYR